jgi:hypothetical protein
MFGVGWYALVLINCWPPSFAYGERLIVAQDYLYKGERPPPVIL